MDTPISSTHGFKHEDQDDEAAVVALAACSAHIFPKALKAAIQLDLFEIVARGGHGPLSTSEIASHLPTRNEGTVAVLDSVLRLLVTHSLLTCSSHEIEKGTTERRYELAPGGKFFVRDEKKGSLAPFHALLSKGDSPVFCLKEAILEGGNLFEKNNKKSFYENMALDNERSKLFDAAMGAHSSILMKRVVKVYDGFEGLSSIVSVGGGNGAILDIIISSYPSIRGINFDLPQVVQAAPSYNGIDHIGGDMFLEIPKGDAILLKFVLHNWGDDNCINILKNCYKALPKKGKLILMDSIVPNTPQNDVHAKYALQMDIIMSTLLGGKERTEDEFEALAKAAGFGEFKVVCYVYGMWVMELIKLG